MSGGAAQAAPPSSVASFASLTGMSGDGGSAYQEERERQASALAAAGMVAETVSGVRAGLAAPPQLLSSPPGNNTSGEVDNINWGAVDMGGVQVDDMDLDFATLFDPSIEEANMQTEGSGWPVSTSGGTRTTAGSS